MRKRVYDILESISKKRERDTDVVKKQMYG